MNAHDAYGKRVRELEAEGLTTSDAQGAADAELLIRNRHTPCPWHHCKVGNNGDQWMIIDDTGRTIGLSYHGEANARLWAASDEMLAALEHAADHLLSLINNPGSSGPDTKGALRKVYAAISNATHP